MPRNYWIISNSVNYYLSGGPTDQTYNGSGTPWTAQTTTPYQTALNDVMPSWTPTAAPSVPVVRGGPPFSIGSVVLDRGWDSVQEQIGILCRGTSHDNAVFLVQQLRKILNVINGQPPILAVQPDNATNIVYYQILYADVQETPSFIGEESASSVARCVVTWLRTPFGGQLSSGETALSSGTMTNTGTGGSPNVRAYSSSLSGDLQNEGQPMNVQLTPISSPINVLFLGSVYSRTYSTTGAGAYAGPVGVVTIQYDASALIGRPYLRPRFLARFSSVPSDATLSITVTLGDGTNVGTTTLYSSATQTWQTTGPILTLSPYAIICDFGTWPNDLVAAGVAGAGTPRFAVTLRMATATSVTLSYTEFLLCYTWCKIESPDSTGSGLISSTRRLNTESFVSQTNYLALPTPVGRAFGVATSNSAIMDQYHIRGELPRYFPGASLYAAWQTDGGHNTTHTATVSATQAPLWATLRGGD